MRFKSPLLIATVFIAASFAHAGGKKLADYRLRVHIFSHQGHSHYFHQVLQNSEGEGRGNLFENSQPTAIDFHFNCPERIMNNKGFETYPARWKKQGRELAILIPEPGKPDGWMGCDLDVLPKPGIAYARRNGNLTEEPTEKFVHWMQKHDYDPENGKNEPVGLSPQEIPQPEPQQDDDDPAATAPIAPPPPPADAKQPPAQTQSAPK